MLLDFVVLLIVEILKNQKKLHPSFKDRGEIKNHVLFFSSLGREEPRKAKLLVAEEMISRISRATGQREGRKLVTNNKLTQGCTPAH